MVKKLLFSLLGLLVLAFGAHAQSAIIINAPAPISGNVLPIGRTTEDGTWGFNRDTTGPVTAPVRCALALDSFACSAFPPGYFDGKIAVVHRGPAPILNLGPVCGFGTKALNAQNAGAVGVIIIYEPREGQPINALPNAVGGSFGTNTDGLLVTIPVLLIDRPTGTRVKAQLCANGNVTMGGFLGYYNNNLSITADKGCISPPSAATPNYFVQNRGDFMMTPSVEISNPGKIAQTNAEARCFVSRTYFNGSQTVTEDVYDHTVPVPAIAGAVTVAVLDTVDFPVFDLATAVPNTDRRGFYKMTYVVNVPNGDESLVDNTVVYDFQVTDNQFSLARLDPVTREFVSKNFVTPSLASVPPTNRVYRYGVVFRTHNIADNDAVLLRSARFGVKAGDSVDFTALNITTEIYEWNDADGSGGVADAEITQLGGGLLTFDSDTLNGKYLDVPFADLSAGDTTIALDRNKTYLAMMTYRGDDIVSWSYEDKGFSYFRYFREQAPTALSPVYVNQWYNGYSDWPVVAMRLDFRIQIGTAVKSDFDKAIGLSIVPNPATDHFIIAIGNEKYAGSLAYLVTDMAGKTLLSGAVIGQNTRVNTADLAPGLYQVRVGGSAGSSVRKIMVR